MGSAFVNIEARDKLTGALSKLSGKLATFGKRAAIGIAAGIGAAIVAALGVTKLAASFEEVESKFNAVFKDLAPAARAFGENLATAVGRSKGEILGMLASLQDTFVPLGFARDQAAALSKEVTTLAIDLASFNNISDSEAMEALQSALIGNGEAVRKFGIILTESSISQELMNMGIEGGNRAASEQQKALARLAIIQRSTTDAQGDALRTSDSVTNSYKGFVGQLKDFGVLLGQFFLPFAAQLLQFGKTVISQLSGIVGGLGDTNAATRFFQGVVDWIKAIVFAMLNWDLVLEHIGVQAKQFFINFVERIGNLTTNVGIFFRWFGDNWKDVLTTAFNSVVTVLRNLGDIVIEFFSALFSGDFEGVKDSLSRIVSGGLLEGFENTIKESPKFVEFIGTELTEEFAAIDAEWTRRWKNMEDTAKEAAENARKELEEVANVDIDPLQFAKKKKKSGSKASICSDLLAPLRAIQEASQKTQLKLIEKQLETEKKMELSLAIIVKNTAKPQVAVAG